MGSWGCPDLFGRTGTKART